MGWGAGLGDELLGTAVLREWKIRSPARTGIVSTYPEIFFENPDADEIFRAGKHLFGLPAFLSISATVPRYAQYDEATGRDILDGDHLITSLCASAGISGPIALRPYWHFKAAELQTEKLAPLQVAIQSSGISRACPIPNKEWFPDRFQAVVDAFSPNVAFVQVGLPQDPPLSNVIDLRGKLSVRETAAVLRQSAAFVGLVGFLMHLARAVECRSVIVYGGREAPHQSGYIANVNIYNPVHCAPCWLRSRCDFDRICMEEITSRDVGAGLQKVLDEGSRELPVETRQIPVREPIRSQAIQAEIYKESLRYI